MVETRSLPPLLSFSALLVCILLHYRLRDWCRNLRKASGHVVCRLGQSASFRIFDSTFYFPHSAIPHFTHNPGRRSGSEALPEAESFFVSGYPKLSFIGSSSAAGSLHPESNHWSKLLSLWRDPFSRSGWRYLYLRKSARKLSQSEQV